MFRYADYESDLNLLFLFYSLRVIFVVAVIALAFSAWDLIRWLA